MQKVCGLNALEGMLICSADNWASRAGRADGFIICPRAFSILI